MDDHYILPSQGSERQASILAHIVVYFECNSLIKMYSAVDIQNFFRNTDHLATFWNLFSDVNIIRESLINKFGRNELTRHSSIE